MRVQRKIFHLLADNGVIGRGFRYLSKINPRHSFNWAEPVLITDKIDGTTVQASATGIFKRRDLFKTGDPRKFTATEQERYTLAKLELDAPENKHIARAVSKYLDVFREIYPVIMVYFEAFGNKIQARYKGLTPDIRVFDVALRDKFQLFEFTRRFCVGWGLPVVGGYYDRLSGVSDIISRLENATHSDEALKPYELEGFVLRQGNQIAKIRKTDLKRVDILDKNVNGGNVNGLG